jgi:hypothetical protein
MLEEFSSSKNVVETNLIPNSHKSSANETVAKQQSVSKTLSSKFNANKPNGYNNKTASVGNATRCSSKTSTKKANNNNNNINTSSSASSTTSINNTHQKLNTSSSSPSDQDQNQHFQYNLLQQQPSSLMYSFVTFEGNKNFLFTLVNYE